ncbi:MAG: NAD(P)-dependent oxidoreductase [Candidatus Thorarchaeota archaeon]
MRILITAPFTESGIRQLETLGLEIDNKSWLETGKLYLGKSLVQLIEESKAEMVIVEGDEIKEKVLEQTNLKFIGCVRGGPNNISVQIATEKGIPVVSVPGRNTNAVAELTIALILNQARKISIAKEFLVKDFFVDDFGDFARLYKHTMGFELSGKKVGIIGLGNIGYEVAKRLNAFDMEILVFDPYVQEDRLSTISGQAVELEQLLKESDIVSVHCPPNDETRGMLGKEEFALMKKTAIFINTARASITDEYALLDALKDGTIAGAGLDVFSMEPVDCDNIFLELDNVTVTPHIGGNTQQTIERQTESLVKAIKTFIDGGVPENTLNPEVFR